MEMSSGKSEVRKLSEFEEEPSLESVVRKISRSSYAMSSSPNGLASLALGYEQYRQSLRPAVILGNEYGEPSSDDLSSEWEHYSEESDNIVDATVAAARKKHPEDKPRPSRHSGWRKLKNMVQWTPFVQTYRHKKYQWVQLAGHSGNFKAGKQQGTVLKKLCVLEEECYRCFENDAVAPFVPDFQGTVISDDDEKFLELHDCLSSFSQPSVMDCKIGVRTYLEDELAKAKENPKLRKDMYDKMVAVDPDAPTEEEHRLKGVTKPRYMVWRETISSTATLGFRIEGVKKSDGTSSKDFKTTKTREQVADAFVAFVDADRDTAKRYLERLRQIHKALTHSKFFSTHELIGSSLLFVHDSERASVWLIDFGKTVRLPEGVSIDHRSPWAVGNHEDGYLIGVENLIDIFAAIASDSCRNASDSDPASLRRIV